MRRLDDTVKLGCTCHKKYYQRLVPSAVPIQLGTNRDIVDRFKNNSTRSSDHAIINTNLKGIFRCNVDILNHCFSASGP